MAEVTLNYSKATFVPTLLLSIIALSVLDAFASIVLSFDLASVLAAAIVSVVVIVVLGVSPFLTHHKVEGGVLTLRQGWYFKASIPLEEIASIEDLETGRARTGVYFDLLGGHLYVTTQRRGLVMIKLARPRRYGMALGKKIDKIVFDTTDMSDLKRVLAEKFTPASRDRQS
ncbi:MAG TPA: hypothetical protein VMB46_04660 [Methanomassiliicoccales archaeon]|nr:hypothetical protein [Methanomassiliicoccales archaeon]